MSVLLQVLPFTEDDITYSLMESSPKEEDGENQIQGIALKESFLTDEALNPRGLDSSIILNTSTIMYNSKGSCLV